MSLLLGGDVARATRTVEEERIDREPWVNGLLWTSSRGIAGPALTPTFRQLDRWGSDIVDTNGGRALAAPISITADTSGVGHILDSDTAFLWRFNEQPRKLRTVLLDDGTLGMDATATTTLKTSKPVPGPVINGTQHYARRFDAANTNHAAATNATLVPACKTSLTWECFLYRTGGTGHMITVGAANALLARWGLAGGGTRLFYFWEVTGADKSHQQVNGMQVPLNEWCHLALSKDGVNVYMYINGVLVDTIAYAGTEPNGASSLVNIGSNVDVNLYLGGSMKDLKLTSRCKTAAEIAAAAALRFTTFELPVEVDTLLLYRMDDTADLIFDSGPYGMLLIPYTASYAVVAPGPSLLEGDASDGRSLMLSPGYVSSIETQDPTPGSLGYPVSKLREILIAETGWTFEAWIMVSEPLNIIRGLFCFGDPGSTNARDNFLTIDILANGSIQFWSEYGADSDSVVTTAADRITSGKHHLAVRRDANPGGGNHTVSIFIDGVLTDTLTGVVPFNNGDSVIQPFVLGYGATEATDALYGFLDDVRISSIPRSDAEILESYQRGSGYAVADAVAPVVTVDSPAEGEIDPTFAVASVTPLVVRVADALSAIAYVAIFAVLDGSEPVLVFRGDPSNPGGFEDGFDADSTVTLDGAAYVYSIRRNGGWQPGTVDITVDAVDAVGNVVAVP